MRDKRFVAEHRGGVLTKENHQKLIHWARECTEHLFLLVDRIDPRVDLALSIAKEWEEGKISTGVAMKASLGAHAAAREASDPVTIAIARSAGQAVATAHMADHSMGAALYALKAVVLAGKSVDAERAWQNKYLCILPKELVELIQISMKEKEKGFKF